MPVPTLGSQLAARIKKQATDDLYSSSPPRRNTHQRLIEDSPSPPPLVIPSPRASQSKAVQKRPRPSGSTARISTGSFQPPPHQANQSRPRPQASKKRFPPPRHLDVEVQARSHIPSASAPLPRRLDGVQRKAYQLSRTPKWDESGSEYEPSPASSPVKHARSSSSSSADDGYDYTTADEEAAFRLARRQLPQPTQHQQRDRIDEAIFEDIFVPWLFARKLCDEDVTSAGFVRHMMRLQDGLGSDVAQQQAEGVDQSRVEESEDEATDGEPFPPRQMQQGLHRSWTPHEDHLLLKLFSGPGASMRRGVAAVAGYLAPTWAEKVDEIDVFPRTKGAMEARLYYLARHHHTEDGERAARVLSKLRAQSRMQGRGARGPASDEDKEMEHDIGAEEDENSEEGTDSNSDRDDGGEGWRVEFREMMEELLEGQGKLTRRIEDVEQAVKSLEASVQELSSQRQSHLRLEDVGSGLSQEDTGELRPSWLRNPLPAWQRTNKRVRLALDDEDETEDEDQHQRGKQQQHSATAQRQPKFLRLP